jgi:hypothetical protein
MVVDRINRAVLRFLGRRTSASSGSVQIDANGIEARTGSKVVWSMDWTEIQRVTAFRTAGFVGDALVLAIEGSGGSHIVSEGAARLAGADYSPRGILARCADLSGLGAARRLGNEGRTGRCVREKLRALRANLPLTLRAMARA